MKTSLIKGFALSAMLAASPLYAADYVIDTEGGHASINFRISHLGTSWLTGRFNDFSGEFSYDEEKPEASKISVDIDVTSLDSNHAERDKHIRGKKYLDVSSHPKASFTSTSFTPNDNGGGVMKGTLTLYGTSKEISIDVKKVGEGKDPWGGYRAGFEGTTAIKPKDFGMKFNLGPAAKTVYMDLHIEGIRK